MRPNVFSRTARASISGQPRYAQYCWLTLLAAALLAGCGRAPEVSRAVLTRVDQLRQLNEAGLHAGTRARIQGVLTYYDEVSSFCFVQDTTGGMRVNLAPGQVLPASGWRVEVSGLASVGGATPALVDAHVSAIAEGVPPPPLPVASARLEGSALQYKRVVALGIVRSVNSERPGLVKLELRAGKTTFWANVPASPEVINDGWVDAEVRARGVLDEPKDGDNGASSATLWVSDYDSLEIKRAATPLNALPVTKIGALLKLDPQRTPAHRVHLQGVPFVPLQGGLAVMDADGEIPIHIGQVSPDPNATVLDVAGFVSWESGHLALERAVLLDSVRIEDGDQSTAPGAELTTALAIHRMPLSAAQKAFPVRLHAVVTFFDPGNHLLFVQDKTDGIFVVLSEKEKGSMRAGDAVEVTGVTTADFAPDVAKARIQVLGHPGLPVAKSGRFGSAAWGREDCHWLELEGVVQRVSAGRADSLLTLAWGKNTYKAHVLAPANSLAHLLDADVKVQGVCGALFNTKHQMLGIQMFVPKAECIRVLRWPLAANPFTLPPTAIADILQFAPARESAMGHRVRVRGAVTFPNRSGSTWIRDATGGLMIRDHQAQGLAVGDIVDATGFPEISGFSPVLRGAEVQRVQPGPPPAPVAITAMEALKGTYDGLLVQIEGRLVDHLQQPGEHMLVVESGQIIFNANLPAGGAGERLEPGARVRLTGICSVETEQSRDLILPRTFHLLLRSRADAVVLGLPPFLTVNRVVPILSGAVLLILAALAWAALLRRRVRSQTFALRAQTVQLQAAHQKTREALRKAFDAEAMDLDSKRVLECIARDEPVELIIDHIAESVALHCEGSVCVILLEKSHRPQVSVVPAMPPAWMETLSRIDLNSVSFSPEFRPPKHFSDDPLWEDFIESQQHARFRTCFTSPIVIDGATTGAIATFFRDEKRLDDTQCRQLGLWCNMAALALERRRLHDKLSYRAQHDGLTGLPNRLLLYERLEAEIAQAGRCNALLGVLFIDLDGFKQINDTKGHDAGDKVLQEAARRMTQIVRRADTVARIGGDEFVILLPLLAHREDAEQVAEKIVAAIREPLYVDHMRLVVSACVGISIWPIDGELADPLLRAADKQMYRQKRRRWYDAPGRPTASPDVESAVR